MPNLVLTVIAEDRPGLVARLSDTVAAHGGSWEESRMARLSGSFAGIVLVCVDPARADDLQRAVRELSSAGVVQVEVSDAHAAPGSDGGRTMRLHLTGQDHPGIVRDVTQALADRGVTIDELETATVEAPMAGGVLFEADAVVRLPDGTADDDLRTRLEQIADEIMVDLTLDAD